MLYLKDLSQTSQIPAQLKFLQTNLNSGDLEYWSASPSKRATNSSWFDLHILFSSCYYRYFFSFCQQMAETAEVLPTKRKLGLAQRVQNTPQSWYTNTTDRRVNLKEVLHRSCKWFTGEERLSVVSRVFFPICASFYAFTLCNLSTVSVSLLQTKPEMCNSAVCRPGAGRQLCRNWVSGDAWALLWRWAPVHTQLWQEVRLIPTDMAHADLVDPVWDEVKLFVPLPWFCSHTRKNLTLKYYAKKILYFLRQQNILKSLKSFLERPAEEQSPLEGVAFKQIQPKLHCALFWWWR